jgi:VWFA-related protein
MYEQCYPGLGPTPLCPDDDQGVADELIQRHREKQTLDALGDLMVFLRGVRDERKAILAITDGWRLFKPNHALTRRLNCAMPQARVGIDPRTGRLTTTAPSGGDPSYNQCDSDRALLAQMDSDEHLRRIVDQANRANASFYPIDPRGLVAFDTSIAEPRIGARPPGTPGITPPRVDSQLLQSRANSLRDLAFATDGMAIIDTNNLDAGLRRVTDDLSSYYLLAYYSTGRLDGKFHAIRVRVKRPGVQVRARRGYLAPTVAEVTSRAAPALPSDAAAAADARALDLLLASLNSFARDTPLRLQGVAGWTPNNTASIAVIGEVGSSEEWKAGADADVMLTNAAGETLASGRATVAAGTRGFRLTLTPSQPLVAGDYTVRVRARGRAAAAAPANEVLRLTLPASPAASGAMFIRRGPATGNREVPTADLRFRRTEQLRVELPAADGQAATARLLDRTGKPIAVPVAVAVRDDADGSRWQTAQVTLAPLAAGDYIMEMATGAGGAGATGSETRTLLAFRVIQ